MTGDKTGYARECAAPAARYAIYYAPEPRSALARFGTAWLERRVPETDTPRIYGFHATLKAPFPLSPGRTVEELRDALEAFAGRRQAFDAPPLRLAASAGFLALVLREPSFLLRQLAEDCVRELDCFRARLTPEEIERRRGAGLTQRQSALLLQWGYPYVLEEWRFHMTLSGKLEPPERKRLLDELRPLAQPHCRDPLRIDALALFEQPAPGERLCCIGRYPLGAAP